MAQKKSAPDSGGVRLVYADECKVHTHPHLAKVWQKLGQPLRIPAAGEDRKFAVFGAVGYGTGRLVWRARERKDSEGFLDLLEGAAQAFPDAPIVMALDNVGYQKSRRCQAWWASHQGQIKPCWLPAYTPELNLMERVWRYLKSKLACHRWWADWPGLQAAIKPILALPLLWRSVLSNAVSGGRTMPRSVEIVVPPAQTQHLLASIQELAGVVGLKLERGASLMPQGDVITVVVTNRGLPALTRLLLERNVSNASGTSMATTEPLSYTSASSRDAVLSDTVEATWEEMEMLLQNDSGFNGNFLALMAVAGALAAVGLLTGSLHLVIAAMVIAPGFEPISRAALGVVSQGTEWRPGVVSTLSGYFVLTLTAAATGLALQALSLTPLSAGTSYLPDGVLVAYWTTLTSTSLLVSAAAAVGGALVVSINRPVLTMGAVIGLALIPSAASFGLGLAMGQFELAGLASLRWGVDVVLVAGLSVLVFLWKRVRVQRRASRL